MALYAAADGVWAVYALLGKTLPYPSYADALYLVAYLLFVLRALFLLRGTRPSTGDLVDGVLVASTAAFLIWPLLIVPPATSGGSTLLERLVSRAGDLCRRERAQHRLGRCQRELRPRSVSPVDSASEQAGAAPGRQARPGEAFDHRRRARGRPGSVRGASSRTSCERR
jgi:hypothetical protein